MDNSEYHSFGDKVSNELNAYDEVRFASIEERKDTRLECYQVKQYVYFATVITAKTY